MAERKSSFQGLLFACLFLFLVLLLVFVGKLGWIGGTGDSLFNWHPFLVGIGTILILVSVISFRLTEDHETAKTMHAACHLFGFLCIFFGMVCVYQYHNKNKITNYYSVHSWLGLICAIFLLVQMLVGAFSPSKRELHRKAGKLAVFVVTIAVVLGLLDKQGLLDRADLFSFTRLLCNFLALAVFGASLCAAWIVFDPKDSHGYERVRHE